MLDQVLLRKDLAQVVAKLSRRKSIENFLDQEEFLELENHRKKYQVLYENLLAKRNNLSNIIGKKKAAQENVDDLMEEVRQLLQEIESVSKDLGLIQSKLDEIMLNLPNLPHDSVPDGLGEENNVVIETYGNIKQFDFPVLDHVELGSKLGLDLDAGVQLAGSRFMLLKGDLAKLHRALIQFMLDVHTYENSYEEVYVPYMVNERAMLETAKLPKFKEDLFCVKSIKKDEKDFYLIPTAEVPLTCLVSDKIVALDKLPLRYVAHTPCFRSEAGSYGKDIRGIIRMHQFEKVEMVQIVEPNKSYEALNEMLLHARGILEKLNLPYRVVDICSGDLGFSAAKQYDLEVWLPAQKAYREISSCSNIEDFQARRMKARYKDANNKICLLHTLNGSGLAVGRTLVAILENNQLANGDVLIPEVLQDYMKMKLLKCLT